MKMKTAWFDEMSWMEVQQAIKDTGGIAIIPLGCLEQWAHLPVGCDNFQAMGHVKKIIELAQEDPEIKQLMVLPLQPMGCCPRMADYPGTVSIRFGVLREYYKDIAESLIKHGVLKIIWITGHSTNTQILVDLGSELKDKYGVLNIIERCWITAMQERGPRPAGTPRGGHASGGLPFAEIRPGILEAARANEKAWFTEGKTIQGWGTDDFTDPTFNDDLGTLTVGLKTSLTSRGEPMKVYMCGSWQDAMPYGNLGDPTGASVEESHRGLEVAAKHTIAIIKAIRKIKVPLKSNIKENLKNL